MDIIYTNAAKFAGVGIGSIAYRFSLGLHNLGHLKRAIIAYTDGHEIPTEKVISFPWMRMVARLARDHHPMRDTVFDHAAARFVQPCDIFHGWSHQCLQSLKRAKELGAVTFVERQNSHDHNQYALLREEFDRWGGTREPVASAGMERGLAEFELADYVTVPSWFAYESMIAAGIAKERLLLVPYGVDLGQFSPGCPPEDEFRLLFVGQVSLRKGVPYLLQAWERLNLPRASLWLVGRVTPDAEAVVTPYYQNPTVRFFGSTRSVTEIYRQVSAFVLPSIEEGSALVTYEAMASGLPLIFTHNCGAVARDGIEGVEVPIRDVHALSAAIERLYLDRSLRMQMGNAGRARAADYTWDAAVQRLVTNYAQVLRDKRESG